MNAQRPKLVSGLMLALMCALALSGCATNPYYITGGSRAGGTVNVACTINLLFDCDDPGPEIFEQARDACRAWGYSDAQPFGAAFTRQTGPYEKLREIPFQCLGDLEL